MLDKIRKTHERLNSHTHRIGKYDLALYTTPPQPAAQEPVAFPMESAPRDSTLVRLLVNFEANSLEDSPDPVWTIGANCFDNDGIDEWKFAGWDWSQDCFAEGAGKPIGWLPMLSATPPSAVPVVGQLVEAFDKAEDSWMRKAIELESQMQGLSNEINDFQNTIERQKREIDALEADNLDLRSDEALNEAEAELAQEVVSAADAAIDAAIAKEQS